MSVYDADESNGFMIIFGDNGIVLFDVMTQTTRHMANWDSYLSLSQKKSLRSQTGNSLISFDWISIGGSLKFFILCDGTRIAEIEPTFPD